MRHFEVTVIDFNGIGNTYQGTYTKSFDGNNCEFQEVSSTDSVKASAGVQSKILYYPGGAAGNPIEYYTATSVEDLIEMANDPEA